MHIKRGAFILRHLKFKRFTLVSFMVLGAMMGMHSDTEDDSGNCYCVEDVW